MDAEGHRWRHKVTTMNQWSYLANYYTHRHHTCTKVQYNRQHLTTYKLSWSWHLRSHIKVKGYRRECICVLWMLLVLINFPCLSLSIFSLLKHHETKEMSHTHIRLIKNSNIPKQYASTCDHEAISVNANVQLFPFTATLALILVTPCKFSFKEEMCNFTSRRP